SELAELGAVSPLGRGALVWPKERGARCERCDRDFPPMGPLPCLMPDPDAFRDDVQQSLEDYASRTVFSIESMVERLALAKRPSTLDRIKTAAAAATQASRELLGLCAEVQLVPAKTSAPAWSNVLVANIATLRDWGWHDGEHEENHRALAACLRALHTVEVAPSPRILVLGAGGGRLAFDLHHRLAASATVATDVNPLPLLLAERVVRGHSLDWHEFPLAPKRGFPFGQAVRLHGRSESTTGLTFALADGIRPPFANESFDVVVTPWFIDQVVVDTESFVDQVHRLLRAGGVWLNHGPLLYPKEISLAERWTIDEVVEMAVTQGFRTPVVIEARLPYLTSPYSAQARREDVYTFAAQRGDEPPSGKPLRPTWQVDHGFPIPRGPKEGWRLAPGDPLSVMLEGAIDGRASVRDIGRAVARTFGVSTTDACHRVADLLGQAYTLLIDSETVGTPSKRQ
ncbi:MAG: methyltransferase domain-containing protein, partial [Myxococcota bacterium]